MKQSLLYTLMIFFLVLLLVALGAWFKTSMDLSSQSSHLAALKEQEKDLERMLNGLSTNPKLGLKWQVDDAQEGLAVKDVQMIQLAANMKSNTDPGSPGMEERRAQYEQLSPEVEKAWKQDGVQAWETLYKNWAKLNQDLSTQAQTLKTQRDEKEKNVANAGTELAQEEANRETELRKIAQARSKNTQDLENVRYDHESTQQKVVERSREFSKEKKPLPQGRIVQADAVTKTATIDIGAVQGVRKGMAFTVYSGTHVQLLRKCQLEVVSAGPLSSQCMLIETAVENRWDPITHWVPDRPDARYSPYAAKGQDETDAQELERRKTVRDRVEALRIEKIAREQGLEAAENARANSATATTPPNEVSLSLTPVIAGDWIFNPDFIPIISDSEFSEQTRAELVSMKDINIGALTFYIADTVKPYRKEYLKRLCERNSCKLSDVMSPNVNVVVVGVGFTNLDALIERNASKKGKENLKEDEKAQLTTQAALEDARKYAADVLSEEDMEAYFDRRARKQELLKGHLIQPGRSVFFIAGKMRNRSPEILGHYIEERGGVIAKDINAKVDYIVVGESPEAAFIENIKKRGLKIIREDELPEFFGEKH